MVIGPKELLRLVKKIKLVENLSERELTNPEGAGFDIRLDEVYKLVKTKKPAFLGIEDRLTPDIKLLAKYKEGKSKFFKFSPNNFYLVTTIEKTNLPKDITAHSFARSTLFRSGLQLLHTQVAPGYSGILTFGIKNVGDQPIKIELGARIAHLQFEYVKGGGSKYRGQWQGGRVAAAKREKQV